MNYKILIIVTSLLSLQVNVQEVINLKEATIITLENNLNIKTQNKSLDKRVNELSIDDLLSIYNLF